MKGTGERFARSCWERLLGSVSGPAEGDDDESTAVAATSLWFLSNSGIWGESGCESKRNLCMVLIMFKVLEHFQVQMT